MKDLKTLLDIINKSKISQKDRFILLFMVCLAYLIQSIGLLIFAKQLPDFVQWVLTQLGLS
jgi:hypothetical protein